MISILIPVLNRPQNVRPVIASIHENTALEFEILFLCSPGDTEEIAEVGLAQVEGLAEGTMVPFPNGPGDWAKKINYGVGVSSGDFLLLGADDLRFHPSWDENAMEVASTTGAGVVGTNDLGNATVMRGDHATHPLVRRSYIANFGTIDEPGKCLHEGYAHQWVDTELVQTAKRRGQWAFAKDSLVEHLHPFWKKGKMDDTYRQALSTSSEDHALYQQRCRLWSRAAMRS